VVNIIELTDVLKTDLYLYASEAGLQKEKFPANLDIIAGLLKRNFLKRVFRLKLSNPGAPEKLPKHYNYYILKASTGSPKNL
jgi:hypothetical protein